MGDIDVTDCTHAFLAFFLFFEQFAFTGDVTTITLGCDVFTYGFNGLAGNDLGPDGCLDGDFELLTRDQFLEFGAHFPAEILSMAAMNQRRERINGITV